MDSQGLVESSTLTLILHGSIVVLAGLLADEIALGHARTGVEHAVPRRAARRDQPDETE